jgi:hypothetical protein
LPLAVLMALCTPEMRSSTALLVAQADMCVPPGRLCRPMPHEFPTGCRCTPAITSLLAKVYLLQYRV